MKIIRVEALQREGHPYRACAQRFFPGGHAVELEVLDQEDDFEVIGPDGNITHDPATTIDVDVTNSTTGRPQKAKRPHPTRIGQRAYREIKADQVLRILEGGETSATLSHAALDAARKQAADLAGDLVVVKAKLAAANETIAKLEAQVADLKAAAEVKAGDAGARPAEASEPPADKGGKASKGK